MNRKNENLSTEEIIKLALSEKDEDARWNLVVILHRRGNKEVFSASEKLCRSGVPNQIALGADILGQLGFDKLPFKKESIPILLNLADETKDIEALQSVIMSLGRMEDDKIVTRLLEFKDHENEDIRFAVVHGLLTIKRDYAIKAMIKLSQDSDEDVRNWATFGLGSMIETDTKEIRDALFQRLDEKDHEIRGEALVGLAIRKDKRVIKPLLKELSSKKVGSLSVEAALEIGDESLCSILLELKDWWDIDKEMLDSAINKCCAKNTEIK